MTKRKNIYADDRIIRMGERLRELRNSQKLTISQLAEQIGLSERMVSNYERGENAISLEFIIKIYESRVFEDRSLEELLRFFVVEIYT
ncbi:helix-turn-helix transcriptional regulator [Lysinibacillus fusiformis]|uniref:helix-turn-helix domain-containing protein n=1 Tax=Lysinibacillus fusiformis TaxID=28031 RepID=UPI002D773567|nr:helix-turn-helix transcriptional regulator [Lysinibacillus fusiformis]WRS97928.1 helix-turn-helix transcriptional regulator [Lysinibacillus fusiformis]